MAAGDNFFNSRDRMYLAIDPFSTQKRSCAFPTGRTKTGRPKHRELGFCRANGSIFTAEPTRITQFAGFNAEHPIDYSLKSAIALCLSAEQHKTIGDRTCAAG